MIPQRAVVLGATGFIGQHLVQQLIADTDFSHIRLLVRRPLETTSAKMESVVTDFTNAADFKNKLGTGDVIFCCTGTTMQQVKGDKAAYRKIDFDIPVQAAWFGKEAGFTKYSNSGCN